MVSATASRFIQASISTSPVSCCCATAATRPSRSKESAASTAAMAPGAATPGLVSVMCLSGDRAVRKGLAKSGRLLPKAQEGGYDSAAPAQHAIFHGVDEGAVLARRTRIFAFEPIVPTRLSISIVDQGKGWIVLEPKALLCEDPAVLLDEIAQRELRERLYRRDPGCGPISRIVHLGLAFAEWRHCAHRVEGVTAEPDNLDARARQAEENLGLRRAAQDFVREEISRRLVSLHGEAVRRGAEILGFVVHRAVPPPRDR